MGRLGRSFVVSGLVSTAVVLSQGCLGEAERGYFDDTDSGGPSGTGTGTGTGTGPDGSGVDAFGGQDGDTSIVPVEPDPDSGSEPPDSGSAPPDSGSPPPDSGSPPPDSGSPPPDSGSPPPDSGSGPPDSGSSGCGPTNTATNCGACGVKCDTTTASVAPTCNGTSCVYSCKPGLVDCNTTAPDTNGCECAGDGCCGSSCQTKHSNGIGQNYYDCNPLGTYTEGAAMAACVASTGTPAQCALYVCVGNDGSLVCSLGAGCTCWKYDPGKSGINGRISTSCLCPISASDPSWN
jgi:hypothetical protein